MGQRGIGQWVSETRALLAELKRRTLGKLNGELDDLVREIDGHLEELDTLARSELRPEREEDLRREHRHRLRRLETVLARALADVGA